MLINKLIQKLVSSQLRYNPAFLFAGQTKAEKPKQAKKAPQASSKGKKSPPVKSEAELKKQAQKFQQDRKLAETILASKTKTGSFYRDTIRQVNINKLTQRAYFNDQSLMMMINSATRKDINIIHEAYFNYLGHNTLILNKTVDNLLTKTISLAEKQPDLIQDNIKKVFDIYRNHQYFGYFPHYDTTIKVAKFAAQNGKLPLFISTLSEKLLIKLNAKSVNQLFQITKQWEDFMRLTKLLIFRFNRGLLTDLNKQKMLSYIFKGIKDIQKIKATSQSKQYNKFLESFQTPSIDLALAWLVVKGKQNKAAQILKNIEEKHPRLQSFSDILTKIQGQKEEKKIKEKLKGFLQGTPHQQFLK